MRRTDTAQYIVVFIIGRAAVDASGQTAVVIAAGRLPVDFVGAAIMGNLRGIAEAVVGMNHAEWQVILGAIGVTDIANLALSVVKRIAAINKTIDGRVRLNQATLQIVFLFVHGRSHASSFELACTGAVRRIVVNPGAGERCAAAYLDATGHAAQYVVAHGCRLALGIGLANELSRTVVGVGITAIHIGIARRFLAAADIVSHRFQNRAGPDD